MKRLVLVLALAACRPAAPPYAVVAVPDAWPHRSDAAAITGSEVVASDAPLASQAGVEILAAGGNAVDAAVATGFALAVVYPEAGNLGGGGFTVIRMADGTEAAVDYREVAPLAATRTMFLDDSGRVTNRSVVGPLASGVPGSVAGLVATHARFGKLPLGRVMAPAIRMADAFVVDSQLARSLDRYARLIGQFAGAELFLPGGKALAAGATLRQPALARTLRAIADSGAPAFYTGSLSRTIAADLRAAGAIITAEDLARYKAEWRTPLRGTYRGLSLLTMPPPSSGVTLIETLNLLEGFELPRFGSAGYAHLVASALQRAFMDRNTLIGDPAFVSVPTQRLVSKEHAAGLRKTIGERALPSRTLPPPPGHDGTQTTHYAVVDRAGNAVSTTTTINDLYGSGVYLPGAGFFMNDEMDDFAANPGKPNLYGLIQGEQNAIQPGKRMLSSMVPTIVVGRDGRPLLLVGGRGGPRIISATVQTILNVVDHRMSIVDAINAPRLHHQSFPDTIRYERDGFTATMLDSLRAMGWGALTHGSGPAVSPSGNLGSINAILRTPRGWVGYSDPRSGGRPAAK